MSQPSELPLQISHQRKVRYLVDAMTGCWVWQLGVCGRHPHMYPSMRYKWRRTTAHRIFYELLVGPIPAGYEIHHTCENKMCVNPDHLEAKDSVAHHAFHEVAFNLHQRSKTHCPQGHFYDDENTGNTVKGRYCRRCDRERHRRSAVRFKEENFAPGPKT